MSFPTLKFQDENFIYQLKNVHGEICINISLYKIYLYKI